FTASARYCSAIWDCGSVRATRCGSTSEVESEVAMANAVAVPGPLPFAAPPEASERAEAERPRASSAFFRASCILPMALGLLRLLQQVLARALEVPDDLGDELLGDLLRL